MDSKERLIEELISDIHKCNIPQLPIYEEIDIASSLVDMGWQKTDENSQIVSKKDLEEFIQTLYYNHKDDGRSEVEFCTYYANLFGIKLLSEKEYNKKYKVD